MSVISKQRRVTPHQLLQKKLDGQCIVSLTAYDYSTAKIMDQTGVVDFLLVGDSLGMVVLGYPDTLSVTVDDMIHHTKAVVRGTQRALVVTDMPFMSVNIDIPTGMANAARMIQEGQANAVKIEGATEMTLALIRRLTEAGIPVMGHLGFTPQSVHTLGGFKVQGKTIDAARKLLHDAQAVEQAGAFAVVLEMVPTEVSVMISRLIGIPTIGIGAGPGCDGQILVIDDLVGKYPDFKPRFVRNYAQVGEAIQQAVKGYAADVMARTFPDIEAESFHFPPEMLESLQLIEQSITLLQSPSVEKQVYDCC